MQPGDQAALVFIVVVFLIFSVTLAYATWQGGRENKAAADRNKKK
jgi:hypothetical protein